jgi:hypothetical protein
MFPYRIHSPFFNVIIVKAPGMTVAEVGDRAKVKEGCEWGGDMSEYYPS